MTQKRKLLWSGGAVFLVFAFALYYLGGGKERAAAEAAERARVADSVRTADSLAAAEKAAEEAVRGPVYNSSWDGSVAQVKDYLKSVLNDWKSYDAEEWGPVMRADSPKYRYVVRHRFRAANALGATVLNDWKFYLDSTGVVVQAENIGGAQ